LSTSANSARDKCSTGHFLLYYILFVCVHYGSGMFGGGNKLVARDHLTIFYTACAWSHVDAFGEQQLKWHNQGVAAAANKVSKTACEVSPASTCLELEHLHAEQLCHWGW